MFTPIKVAATLVAKPRAHPIFSIFHFQFSLSVRQSSNPPKSARFSLSVTRLPVAYPVPRSAFSAATMSTHPCTRRKQSIHHLPRHLVSTFDPSQRRLRAVFSFARPMSCPRTCVTWRYKISRALATRTSFYAERRAQFLVLERWF